MGVKILVGDCRERMRELEDGSIHCCITSPPYWGLRNYGTEPVVWGGDAECVHEWGDWREKHDEREATKHGKTRTTDRFYGSESRRFDGNHQKHTAGQFCSLCDAWRGSLGLESTPDLYVQHIVEIMREVKRVLRDDGTAWLNLGDSYASSTFSSRPGGKGDGITGDKAHFDIPRPPVPGGLKPKDLIGIPWRVAFALQDDGWWLRSSIIWAKGISFGTHKTKCPHCNKSHEATYSGSSMPESVRDRPSQSYEYVFLLSKSKRYFYDQEAVKEKTGSTPHPDVSSYPPGSASSMRNGKHQSKRIGGVPFDPSSGRNLRSVWTINPRGFKEAHFATFPISLVTPMMKAGTSERGCCEECGAQWVRVIAVSYTNPGNRMTNGPRSLAQRHETPGFAIRLEKQSTTLGWRPTCICYQASPWPFKNRKIKDDMLPIALPLLEEYSRLPTIPCTALDPFGGAGTVGVAATQLGRDAILCELNQDYCDMSRRRIEKTKPIEVVINKGTKKQDVFVAEQSTMFPVEVL